MPRLDLLRHTALFDGAAPKWRSTTRSVAQCGAVSLKTTKASELGANTIDG